MVRRQTGYNARSVVIITQSLSTKYSESEESTYLTEGAKNCPSRMVAGGASYFFLVRT